MSTAADNFMRGAEMARRLADEYRRDAQKPETPSTLKAKWIDEANRADERAEWYEQHARIM